jgi:putative sigma-54 modulation protein
MKYRFVGKNMEVNEHLRNRFAKKAAKLEKFFNPDTEAIATMSILKNWHVLELTIVQNGITFRAEEKSNDMYVTIDRAVDIIERQIRKNKTRLSKKIHENAFKPAADGAEEAEETGFVVEEREFPLLRTKKFPVKPMTVDEAILQMNLLSHEFFVFVNSETKQVNVVYKRKDDSYGLIEPEF